MSNDRKDRDRPDLTLEMVRRKFPEARESWGKNGIEYNTHCPFPHQKGGIWKFYINSESGTYYCQDCGRSGSSWDSFFNSMVAGKFGHLHFVRDRKVEVPRDYRQFFAASSKGEKWGSKGNVLAPGKTVGLEELGDGHPAWEFLVGRGLDPSEFADPDHPFHALYCTKGQVEVLKGQARSEARIVYPVISSGDVIGWTARLIEKTSGRRRWVWDGVRWSETQRLESGQWSDHVVPKWLHLPSMPKAQILYNLDEARHYGDVVAAEGPFDVHKIGEFAVGYFGEFPSKHQTSILKTHFERIIWMPDRSVDLGSRRAKDFIASVSDSCRLDVLQITEYADPGDCPREFIHQKLSEIL